MAAAVVLGSIQPGVGKTTVTAGIAAALRAQGCQVASLSVGTGLACQPPGPASSGGLPQQPLGLDGRLLSCDAARAALLSAAATADVCLIDGCLGMFDSPPCCASGCGTDDPGAAGGNGEAGSTSQMAAWLGVPLVLIIDGQAFSTPRAIVALVRGHAGGSSSGRDGSSDSSSSNIAGIILNRAPRQALAGEAAEALSRAGLGHVAVLGAVPKLPDCEQLQHSSSAAWSTAAACSISLQGWISCSKQQQLLAQHMAQHIDLPALRRLAATAAVPQPQAPLPAAARTFRASMGVAHDEAFYRYFQQNLRMLQAAGVQLVPFSPLHDSQLPAGLSAVLLGGGAVAQHAARLAANAPMLAALRAFAAAGGLVVGEGDALMYLAQSLQQQQGQQQGQQQRRQQRRQHSMVGLLPLHTRVQQPQRGAAPHAYVAVRMKPHACHPLLLPGAAARGLATCSFSVVEERPVGGGLAAALAAAEAPATKQLPSRLAGSSGGGSSSSSCDAPQTPPSLGSDSDSSSALCAADAGQGAAAGVSYSHSYSVTPLSQEEASAPAGGVDEGYACGSALASAVQLHYGTCPALVQHMARKLLGVDVASVTTAASQAAQAAAALSAAAEASPRAASSGRLSLSVEVPDSPPCVSSEGGVLPHAIPSPGSRALSAPNLQQMGCQAGEACEPCSAPASAAPGAAGDGVLGQTWFTAGHEASSAPAAAPQLSPARKSASVPGGLWQLGGAADATLQQQQQYYHQHTQYQQPFGARGISCPAGAGPQGVPSDNGGMAGAAQPAGRWTPPAFNVPKRWSLELQKLGSSLTNQLMSGASKPDSPTHASGSGQLQRGGSGSRHHSRSSSRVMVHLPEEAPLSEAAIRLLDTSLPALLGRTHHTHIGLAVPLTGGAPSAAGSSAAAPSMGGPSLGGSSLQAGELGSMSRSSSVHEQMSHLAASLAQQEAAAGGSGGSLQCFPLLTGLSDHGSAVGSYQTDAADVTALISASLQQSMQQRQEEQQQQLLEAAAHKLQHAADAAAAKPPLGISRHSRLSLDQLALYAVQQQAEAAGLRASHSAVALARLSSDGGGQSAFAAAAAAAAAAAHGSHQPAPADGSSGELAALQPELSLRAGLGGSLGQQHAGSYSSLPDMAAPSMVHSKSKLALGGSRSAAATPKAAAALAATAAAAASFQAATKPDIISLSPAATDCLISLGLSARLAGVTDACRLVTHSSRSSYGGGSSSQGGCGQLLQLLDGIAVPWAEEAAAAAAPPPTAAAAAPPDVVCRLVDGPDGLPRYKLDEDRIRLVQPLLVVVACEEDSGCEEPNTLKPYAQQLKGGSSSANSAAAPLPAVAGNGAPSSSSSGDGAAVAVPGRVRLQPAAVQRVLQRAGVWGERRAVVLYQRCHSLAEVLEFMLVLAEAAGVRERGVLLVQGLRARLRAAAARVCMPAERLACSAGQRKHQQQPRVAVVDGVAPLRLAGYWVPELLQLAGAGQLQGAPAPSGAPVEVSWAALKAAAPDVLLLVLPGLSASQASLHLAGLAALPGFWALPAVRAGAVVAVDHALLLRPGPCLVSGLELLAHVADASGGVGLPAGLPTGSVLKLALHGGQRCRPRLVPSYCHAYGC